MTDQQVAAEVAESEFERFCDAMDIDTDPLEMDEEELKGFAATKRALIKSMCAGQLVIDEAGRPVYTPRLGDNRTPIVFSEPTGASYMAMDSKKKSHDVTKMYAAMADMTGQPIVRFSRMANRDIKVCQKIIVLFMA